MNLKDPILSSWAAIQLFAKTVTQEDESNEHIIYTIESKHPYRPGEKITGAIFIPSKHSFFFFLCHEMSFLVFVGAVKLRIYFDKRCRTDSSDSLVFYEDEECTRIAKSKKPLSFSLVDMKIN